MHRLDTQTSEITHDVIGSAIEVHREKGPGLLESIHEWCLSIALGLRGYQVRRPESVAVHWMQFRKEYPLRFDLLVSDCLLVELKAVEAVNPIHQARLLRDRNKSTFLWGGSSISTNKDSSMAFHDESCREQTKNEMRKRNLSVHFATSCSIWIACSTRASYGSV